MLDRDIRILVNNIMESIEKYDKNNILENMNKLEKLVGKETAEIIYDNLESHLLGG